MIKFTAEALNKIRSVNSFKKTETFDAAENNATINRNLEGDNVTHFSSAFVQQFWKDL